MSLPPPLTRPTPGSRGTPGVPGAGGTPGGAAGSRPGARLVVLLLAYLALLTWVVLWKLEVPFTADDRAVKVVPFVSVGVVGASAPLEVVANLLLFLPFGAYLGLLAPSWPWWRSAGLVAATSLSLEVAQYVLGVGRSDVTDVLVNTAGGLLGLALVALVRRSLGARGDDVLVRVGLLGTGLALLAVALYVLGPVHVVHVRDVGPLSRAPAGGAR